MKEGWRVDVFDTVVIYPARIDLPDIFHERQGARVDEPLDACVLCTAGLCVQRVIAKRSHGGRRIVVHARSNDG